MTTMSKWNRNERTCVNYGQNSTDTKSNSTCSMQQFPNFIVNADSAVRKKVVFHKVHRVTFTACIYVQINVKLTIEFWNVYATYFRLRKHAFISTTLACLMHFWHLFRDARATIRVNIGGSHLTKISNDRSIVKHEMSARKYYTFVLGRMLAKKRENEVEFKEPKLHHKCVRHQFGCDGYELLNMN